MRSAAGSRSRVPSDPFRTEQPIDPAVPYCRVRPDALARAGDRGPGRVIPLRVGWTTALALLAGIASGPAASGGTSIPYGGAFRDSIEAALFEPGASESSPWRVSPRKVEAYREYLKRRLQFVSEHVYNSERIDAGKSDAKARATARSRDSIVALEHLFDLLDRLEAARDPSAAYAISAEILMVDYGTRSHTKSLASLEVPIHIKNIALEWSLPGRTRPRDARREASNLVNPETGEFYTPDELEVLIRAGEDLSKLNPPDESPFWRPKDDIAGVDVIDNYFEGGDPVHEDLVAVFPPFEGAELDLIGAHKTQTKPKLDVYYLDAECRAQRKAKRRKCRRKYKLKLGMETQADPVANALLSALGFNADVSMHLRHLRVYLGDMTFQELQAEWAGYFDRQRLHLYLPLNSVLLEGDAGHGRDERGEYVVFREAVAEPRYDEIVRLGFFSFSHGMAAVMREARSLHLFGVWIGNADTKDEENNKLSLRRDEHGAWRMYLTQQDVGHSMGMVLPERPNAFPWDVVEDGAFSRFLRRIRGRTELNYLNLQDSGLEDTTTWADAKWMARLIAQLTREQIEDAVSLGHWPGGVGELYVEKLIHRRNQFVEAFGLQDEFARLPVDRHLTTADGSVVNGKLVQNRFPENSMRYDQHWRDVFGPVGGYFADAARRGFQIAIGAVDEINPGNIDISGRFVVSPQILVNVARQVELNPKAQGLFDQYIVRDTLGLGLRVGAGYIAQAEVAWLGRLSMAYPAPTRRLAINARNRTIDFLLPYEVRWGDLPEKYVLLRERSIRGGARVTPDVTLASPFAVGADIAANRVWMHRSVIDHREVDPIVWIDRPRYFDTSLRAFLKLAVVEIPFLVGGQSYGALRGEAWQIDAGRIADSEGEGDAFFERMVRRGDFDGAERIASGPPQETSLDFRHRDWSWSLIFFNSDYRRSEERITLLDADGSSRRMEYRAERRTRFSWSFLDNGEDHGFAVTGFLGPGGGREGRDVLAEYTVNDFNTHSDEFDSYYGFLAGLGAGRAFMAEGFRARDWEVSGDPRGGWTKLLVRGRVHFSDAALERLEHLDEASYWRLLARNLGVGESWFERLRARLESGLPKERMKARHSFADRRVRSAILRARRVLSALEAARGADDEEERLRRLVAAIYFTGKRRGPTYDPIPMATLLETAGIDELLDRGELFVEGRITRAFDDENNLPERRDIVGRLGRAEEFDRVDYDFFPLDAVGLYNMLDWVRETE